MGTGKKKSGSKKSLDRKPIGRCAACGEPAVKRRETEVMIGEGQKAFVTLELCDKHYQRLRRNGSFDYQRGVLTNAEVSWIREMRERGWSVVHIREQLKERFGKDVHYQTVWRHIHQDYETDG